MRSNVVMISRLPGHPHVKYASASVCGCVGLCELHKTETALARWRGEGEIGGCVGGGIYSIIVQSSTAAAVVVQ